MRNAGGWKAALGAASGAALAVVMVISLPLSAHVERDPFFVDPGADTSIYPPAGGTFVEARALATPKQHYAAFAKAVRQRKSRTVLLEQFVRLSKAQQAKALKLVNAKRPRGRNAAALGLTDPKITAEETLVVCQKDSLARLRQSLAQVELSTNRRKDAKRKKAVLSLNRAWAKLCRFSEIQTAVNAANNGDTIVIMPGFYTEPTSRKAPHNDPKCAGMISEDGSRAAPTPTYEYHVACPNDINLIALIGRELGDSDKAPCIRCNVHFYGSGVRPEDVVIDAAKEPKDPGVTGDLFVEGRPSAEGIKEVGLRFERADGAYITNVTVMHLREHGFYSMETDGVTYHRVKAFNNADYGHLSFATDHLLFEDSETAGSGDAGIYPGAAPPSAPRMNSIIRRNDTHHNVIGLSGSMGSGLHIYDNDFHDNSSGIVVDSISRAGHPGYPQRGTTFENNRIYSNNFDTYSDQAWIRSVTFAPIGVGILVGGGNDNVTTKNFIYDNWRWGVGLITVPDIVTEQDSPDDANISTSHRNRVIDNVFGMTPDGKRRLPNGVDIWWDELGESNCWELNGEVTSDPASVPNCTAYPNIGHGNPVKEAELVNCSSAEETRPGTLGCSWWDVPPRPEGSPGGGRRR